MEVSSTVQLSGLPGGEYLFSASRLDRELVADFFMAFARAEYALKRAGFVSASSRGEVRVEWNRFARSLGHDLTGTADPAVREAIRYLTGHPPNKQVFQNGALVWAQRICSDPADPVFLVRSVTTVRNNLFHGGKEIVGLMAERDRCLLESALRVLGYLIRLSPEVCHAFAEVGPEPAAA